MQVRNDNVEVLEQANPGSNCAYNAFLLAICDVKALRRLTHALEERGDNPASYFARFMELSVSNLIQDGLITKEQLDELFQWKKFTKILLDLHKRESKRLQQSLAPVLHQLAVEAIDADSEFGVQSLPIFRRAFEDLLKNKMDSLFSNLTWLRPTLTLEKVRLERRIKKKASEATADDLEETISLLSEWWRSFGAELFKQELKKERTWADDIELKYLADLFFVNLYIKRPVGDINIDQQKFFRRERLHSEEAFQKQLEENLIARGILISDLGEASYTGFAQITRKELETRIQAIPDFKKVLAKIDTLSERGPLEQQNVPTGLSQECITELIVRNIIDHDGRGSYQFKVSAEEALARMCDLENILDPRAHERRLIGAKATIENLWNDDYIHTATIVLNHEADRWDNIRTVAVPRQEEPEEIKKEKPNPEPETLPQPKAKEEEQLASEGMGLMDTLRETIRTLESMMQQHCRPEDYKCIVAAREKIMGEPAKSSGLIRSSIFPNNIKDKKSEEVATLPLESSSNSNTSNFSP